MIKKSLVFALPFASIQSFSQSLNPLSIGTIQSGDSIVVYYEVTINNPCGCTQITNQGNITGSNFASLATNDPKTATMSDPTITPLNMFILPVNIIEFRALVRNSVVQLNWSASEANVERYEVERSTTTGNFNRILSHPANGNGFFTYSLIDPSPISGNNFYRLKSIDFDGKVSYSAIIRVSIGDKEPSFVVFPNPVTDGNVTIQLNNMDKDDYMLELYSSTGQLVSKNVIYHPGGSALLAVPFKGKQSIGLMTFLLRGTKKTYTQKIIVNK